MKPTDIRNPEYFHKVIDCQYACPSHTPVPEYLRLIAEGRYADAYMINWHSNVFPGVLGRICDRPCEPACRRGRVDREPVAICRLKRVAADFKDAVKARMPQIPKEKNGKRVALIGGGPASLTVARDLMPLGYQVDLYDEQSAVGGFMRSQVPSFRLPLEVLDEEIDYILDMGVNTFLNCRITSLKEFLQKGYDAVFIGTGAPRGRDLPTLKGRQEGDDHIHVGIEWLAAVAYGHIDTIGATTLVIGGGNTAMDCCRMARRLGGKDVRVVIRGSRAKMNASPWEIEDALKEDIPIIEGLSPLEFVVRDGRLIGMHFAKGGDQENPVFIACDEVLLAVGQQNAFTWIEKELGLKLKNHWLPVIDEATLQSTLPQVFFGGDAALGPKNVITAVALGHQAAISIDLYCRGLDLKVRPAPGITLSSQKMGVHDWIYDSQVTDDARQRVPTVETVKSIQDRMLEVELGFDKKSGRTEAQRCLNCDVQTVFSFADCIECDACADICPTSCINFINNGEEEDLRSRLAMPAKNTSQDLYVSDVLKTGRVMVKDENVCLHCGLCAERCPTAAWEMVKCFYDCAKAGQ
ncbi:MAG: FAD-dependent oxidoreductase [Desulfocapsaceae bacterium]|nr:FAD-dependent oxidoreductase [Desulfocapsaceae bacterium]